MMHLGNGDMENAFIYVRCVVTMRLVGALLSS